jgi:hypothetical protein
VSYVYAGFAVTFGGLALYALRVLQRGRSLRRALPDEPAGAVTSAAVASAAGPPASEGRP